MVFGFGQLVHFRTTEDFLNILFRYIVSFISLYNPKDIYSQIHYDASFIG